MYELALHLRDHMDDLVGKYEQRLQDISGYAEMPPQARLEAARQTLHLVAACLQTGKDIEFIRFVQQHIETEHNLDSYLCSLSALEAILQTLATDVDAARFLWRMLAQARDTVTAAIFHDIAERKRADERLRLESAALESAANAIVITNRQGDMIWVNPAFTLLTGYAFEEALGQNLRLLKSGWHEADFYRRLWETILAGQVWHGEIVNQRKDGSQYIEEMTITPVTDERGDITHFVAIKQDVTQRREAEEALRESERTLADIINFLPDATFVIDRKSKVIAWNRAMEELTGVKAADMLGKSNYEYALPFHGERRPMLIDLVLAPWEEENKQYETITRQDEKVIGESFVPHLKEGGLYMMGTASALYDSKGVIIGAIESIRDVTERKQAEEQIAIFRALTENATDAIAICNAEGVFTYGNRAWHDLLGYDYTRQEIIGMPLACSWPQDAMLTGEILPEVFGKSGGWRGETQQQTKEGAILEVYMTAFPVQGPSDQMQRTSTNIAIIMRDITEAVQRRQRLLRQQEALVLLIRGISTHRGQTDAALHLITETAADVVNVERFSVWLLEDANHTQALRCIDLFERTPARHSRDIILELGHYPNYLAAVTEGRTIDAHDARTDPRTSEFTEDYLTPLGITSMLDSVIRVEGQIVGVVCSEHVGEPRTWQADEFFFAASIADQVSQVLSQARQEHILIRRAEQVRTTVQVSQQIATAPALDELFRRVVTLIKERFGYYHAQIFRYEPALDAVVLVTSYGEAGQRMLARGHRLPMGRGVVGIAAATRQPILATDAPHYKDWRPNPDLPETRGELAVPIKLRDQVLGILDVQSNRAGALTEDDQLLLEGLCGQIAIAIEDTRLRQEMEEKLGELNRLYRATSHEGWEAFRQTARLPDGYVFDRIAVQPAADAWTPEIERAVRGNVFTPPTSLPGAEARAAVAPLAVSGGEIIGALGVYDDPLQPMTQNDLTLIESVSEQVALALENARLLEQTQTALDDTAMLYQASAQLNAARTFDDILDALRKYSFLGQADRRVSINVFERPWVGEQAPKKVEPVAYWNAGSARTASKPTPYSAFVPMSTVAGQLLKPGAPVIIEDLAADPRVDNRLRSFYRRWLNARSVVFIPLTAAGQFIGYLEAVYQQTTVPSEPDIRRLTSIARQAAVAVQSIRQIQDTQRRARHEYILREVAAAITASEDFMAISLSDIGWYLRELVPLDALSVATFEEGDSEYSLSTASVEAGDQFTQPIVHQPLADSAIGWVITHGQPRLDADLRVERAFAEDEQLAAQGMVSRLILPLSVSGRVVGAFRLSSARPGAFTEEHAAIVQSVTEQMALALERGRLLENTRAALAQVEDTHRRYLREHWTTYLERAAGQSIGYIDSPAGWTPITTGGAVKDQAAAKIAVPIQVRGEPIGALEFYDEAGSNPAGDPSAGRVWSEDEWALIEALADQAALALENARLFEETQSRAQREHVIADITARIRASTDMGTILKTTAEELSKALNLSRARIRLGVEDENNVDAII